MRRGLKNPLNIMEYTSLESQKYYNDCAPLVAGLGYALLALKISPTRSTTKICATITSTSSHTLGLDDCAKVHKSLQARLTALLARDGYKNEVSMQVETPGIDHNIKNAAEFALFGGHFIRVWDKTKNDWVSGVIKNSDNKSVTLTIDGADVAIMYENIAKAKLLG